MPEPKHVLIVEDDEMVRQVITDMLVDLGYRTSRASDGGTMRAFLDAADQPDVIVLDALLPGERGLALARLAEERRIRVVMTTGSAEQASVAQAEGHQLLMKPFRMAELRAALELALASNVFGQRRSGESE